MNDGPHCHGRSGEAPLPVVQIEGSEGPNPAQRQLPPARFVAGTVVVVIAVIAVASALSGSEPSAETQRRRSEDLAAAMPRELLAAERYVSDPSATTVRELLDVIGGVGTMIAGSAAGDFDLVTFDPLNPNHLLASRRGSYGPAQNQRFNEMWTVTEGRVDQRPFAVDRPHDVAHFATDGSVAVWATTGDTDSFAARTVSIERNDTTAKTAGVYASRSVIVNATLFALTDSADYYSTSRQYESFIADRSGDVVVLGTARDAAWVNSPTPEVVVLYPAEPSGRTMVWDATTLQPLPDHPLANLRYERIVVSADGSTGVGITFDGRLERFDPIDARITASFGRVDPTGMAQPVTLSPDGSIAITVDRTGEVTLWWVGDNEPLQVFEADAGPARFLSEQRAPRQSSAVHPLGLRVALRFPARPMEPTSWLLVDTDPGAWIERACGLAGRTLTNHERSTLGLGDPEPACG